MKKALIVASVASMIDQFNMPNIVLLKELGYKVHVACNFEKGSTCNDAIISRLKNILIDLDVEFFHIDFSRNIMKFSEHEKSFKQVLNLVEQNKYDLIHCHSPIGGLITRMAAKKSRLRGTRVIYTAHGFHFYRGAPKKNWFFYYPVEKMCAKYTDVLITINKEDYEFANKKMGAEKIVYVPGVGIDGDKFANAIVDVAAKRKEIGVPKDAFLFFSVGELNDNKNHEIVIRAISKLKNENIHYAIAGKGDLREYLEKLAEKLGVKKQIHLLGFRTDTAELYKTADCFIHPSIREGLPVSVIEAMSSALPVVCSAIRGNVDLVDENGGGLFASDNEEECEKLLSSIIQSDLKNMGRHNVEKAKQFWLENTISIMREIYGGETF